MPTYGATDMGWGTAMIFACNHMWAYEKAKIAGDGEQILASALAFELYVRRAAHCHPDPHVRKKMLQDLDDFIEAEETDLDHRPFVEVCRFLLLIPCIFAAAVLLAAGILVYAVYMLIHGLWKIAAADKERVLRETVSESEAV
ncbi:hypothetical protein OBBRIDRAFT_795233 [Obba rivulosa]|uniref:Uncharacterized protein n=1 Tax=Obba rivulosa TaxID=1052685 RepID=A0A8E2DK35_9APHY|nr:hypothetical protein OBBRIDRAFT_795233 [Obba rivulosa]